MDPRLYQIATLTLLLGYGVVWLDFEVDLTQSATMMGVALGTQWICSRLWRLPRFDPRSSLISGLSLCLLLRTNHLWLAALAAVVTIRREISYRSTTLSDSVRPR